jgi:predicted N-acetyltransferase YhbS
MTGGKSKRCTICALHPVARRCRLIDCATMWLPLRSCVWSRDRTLAAAIRYWPVRIGDRDALLLGPVAVHPTRQGEGLGGFLIRESLAIALALNWHRVLLIGDAPYYRRFGFEKVDDVIMPPPTNPDRILGHSLTENAWKDVQGTVLKYSPD